MFILSTLHNSLTFDGYNVDVYVEIFLTIVNGRYLLTQGAPS